MAALVTSVRVAREPSLLALIALAACAQTANTTQRGVTVTDAPE